MAGSLPSNAPAAETKPVPQAAAAERAASAAPVAAPGGPMTAAEAAAALSRESHADGEDASCATDDDCTFTRLAPGACCAMLCSPRAVTKKDAAALDAHARSCPMSHECPQPSCAPPRQATWPACEKNRCVTRVRDARTPA
jgi:hypothetical protein